MRARQPCDLLGERHSLTRGVWALEPTHQQLDHHSGPTDRGVREPSHVPAVHPARRITAVWAVRTRRAGPRLHRDHPGHGPLDELHYDASQMREQRLETP